MRLALAVPNWRYKQERLDGIVNFTAHYDQIAIAFGFAGRDCTYSRESHRVPERQGRFKVRPARKAQQGRPFVAGEFLHHIEERATDREPAEVGNDRRLDYDSVRVSLG